MVGTEAGMRTERLVQGVDNLHLERVFGTRDARGGKCKHDQSRGDGAQLHSRTPGVGTGREDQREGFGIPTANVVRMNSQCPVQFL